jgi:hypothetical protein
MKKENIIKTVIAIVSLIVGYYLGKYFI